jgi:UDP-N-acetylglucosamine transferase subunit ALG13
MTLLEQIIISYCGPSLLKSLESAWDFQVMRENYACVDNSQVLLVKHLTKNNVAEKTAHKFVFGVESEKEHEFWHN